MSALTKYRDALRHGLDSANCGACAGSCGAWPGELVDDAQPHADELAVALEAAEARIEELREWLRVANAKKEATQAELAEVAHGAHRYASDRDIAQHALQRIAGELDAHPIPGGPAERMRAILDEAGVA